jgi:hypothetical protein
VERTHTDDVVSKGGKYSECASIFSPEKMATSPGQKIALKLMEFYQAGGASVKANQPTKTKEEKAFEFAKDLVNASPDVGYLCITKVNIPTTLPTTTTSATQPRKPRWAMKDWLSNYQMANGIFF